MNTSNSIILKERNCPICKKLFIEPVSNTYKLKIKGKVVHYCSYACYRKVQREQEEKKVRKKRSY